MLVKVDILISSSFKLAKNDHVNIVMTQPFLWLIINNKTEHITHLNQLFACDKFFNQGENLHACSNLRSMTVRISEDLQCNQLIDWIINYFYMWICWVRKIEPNMHSFTQVSSQFSFDW